MQVVSATQANAEIPINENFEGLRPFSTYARNPITTTGLTWGSWGGTWGGLTVSTGTVSLTANTINYIVALNSTGIVSSSTSTSNWNDQLLYSRLYTVTTSASAITGYVDYRAGVGGAHGTKANAALVNSNNIFTKRQAVTPVSLTYSSNIAVDASLSNNYRLLMAGDATLANPTNLVNGTILCFRIKQDATGSRLLTFDTMYKFGTNFTSTLSTAPNAVDLVTCYYDSVDNNLICSIFKGY